MIKSSKNNIHNYTENPEVSDVPLLRAELLPVLWIKGKTRASLL